MSQPMAPKKKMNGCLLAFLITTGSAVALVGGFALLIFFILFANSRMVSTDGWEDLFYENEAQINYVNDNLLSVERLDLDAGTDWYVSEVSTGNNGKDVMVTITVPFHSSLPPTVPLEQADRLSEEEKEAIRALCQGLRLRSCTASFTHNQFALRDEEGLGPVYLKDQTWLESYGGEVDERQWVLWGVTRQQYFDDPPKIFTSTLPGQQPWSE